MSYLNKAMLIGNVGREPEVIEGDKGRMAKFSLATTYGDYTEWHNIVAFGRQVEIVEKYVVKGSSLFVEGPIRTRAWDNKNGEKRYTTEIIANNIQLLSRKEKANDIDDLPL